MKKDLLFIYNPNAGKGRIRNRLMDIIAVLSRAGYTVTVSPTEKHGDAVCAARDRDCRFSMIVCSGGDGTLDEVVTGILASGRQIPVGYIPAGSTNDFAVSLRLPRNMVKAAEIAVNGWKYACDAGAFNQDSFVYIAAFGLLTEVSYETPQEIKNVLGHLAYLLEGMRSLSAYRTYPMKVSYDDICIEDEFLFGMVTNSVSVGGFRKITGKYVELDDGVFEVTLIRKPKDILELNQIMTALVSRNIDAQCMYSFKAKEIHFESAEDVAWTLDGEFGGNHKHVNIKNLHRAIEIMVAGQGEDKG